MSAQRCALFSSQKSTYSGVLPLYQNGSTSQDGDFKSAETPSGAEEPYPTGQKNY